MPQVIPRINEGIASRITTPYRILLSVKHQILQHRDLVWDRGGMSVHLPEPQVNVRHQGSKCSTDSGKYVGPYTDFKRNEEQSKR